ncbi:MAG: glycosyltransferase family 92-domain-containing protein, partial [Monoraphidium minutum]
YFAICAIIKNQHSTHLREWIEYHRFIGARKIYIYDNNSTEPLANYIGDYLHSGLVEYAYFVGTPRYKDLFRTTSQWWAYNDCALRFATRHRWLAFIDGDEFLMFKNGSRTRNIEQFMTDYEQYGGLAVNWVIFGSSGHQVRPAGGVLINYRSCLPSDQLENNHVKVIANTAHLLTVGDDPHTAFYKTKGKFTVNELGAQVFGAKTEAPSHSKIALYHYLTKSEGEFEAKIVRGSAAGNYKNMGFFRAIEELANATCADAVPLGLRCCPSVHHDMDRAAEAAQAAAAGVRPGAGAPAPAGGAGPGPGPGAPGQPPAAARAPAAEGVERRARL